MIVQGIVRDGDNHAFAVAGTCTYPDGSTAPGVPLGPTDARGRSTLRIRTPLCGLFQFDLTNITRPDYVYDPAANEVSPHIEVSVPCP